MGEGKKNRRFIVRHFLFPGLPALLSLCVLSPPLLLGLSPWPLSTPPGGLGLCCSVLWVYPCWESAIIPVRLPAEKKFGDFKLYHYPPFCLASAFLRFSTCCCSRHFSDHFRSFSISSLVRSLGGVGIGGNICKAAFESRSLAYRIDHTDSQPSHLPA